MENVNKELKARLIGWNSSEIELLLILLKHTKMIETICFNDRSIL